MNSVDYEAILQRWFGYPRFRSPQEEIIRHVLGGKHALVVMPTGSGKSLCYQIPALAIAPENLQPLQPWLDRHLVVVLSPLIALMKDQADALLRRGIDAAFINSSLDREMRQRRYRELAEGHFRILYVTPERFRKSEFRHAIDQRDIALLAVDEAHCVSEWGHDFRPDYSRLAEIREMLHHPTTIALTATATPECQDDIVRQLGLGPLRKSSLGQCSGTDRSLSPPAAEETGKGFSERTFAPQEVCLFHTGIERPNLRLEVEEVWDETDKLDQIEDILKDPELPSGSGIIYFSLIKTLERFSDLLQGLGINHLRYHGELPRHERRRIQERFMSDDCPLVLATNAFGMGIDKEDIRFVLHADLPGSMEAYYQEIGRAGRDGEAAVCRLLYDQRDLMTQMQFIEWRNPDADFFGRLWHYLTERHEEVKAFGLDWLNDQLQSVSRHDHRLSTGLGLLDRHGVIAGPRPPECFQVRSGAGLPEQFRDERLLAEKKQRDQQRLYALVEYTRAEDRRAFLNGYFGVA